MKIEENKIRRVKPDQRKTDFFQSYSGNRSQSLLNENMRVIKLIHQKIYPLHHLQRSALVFPKLKENYGKDSKQAGAEDKSYIEITLEEDQQSDSLLKPRTDLENQHICKRKLSSQKNTQKFKPVQRKTDQQKRHLSIMNQKIKLDRCLLSEKDNYVLIPCQNWENAPFFQAQSERIQKEVLVHCQYLRKMKQNIKKQKDSYYKNVNFTQILDNMTGGQKQNYSIQYLVNSIENKLAKNASNLPYDQQSPNKLGQFVKLFENKKRNLMLWQELELPQPVLQKQKSTGEELRSMNHIRSKHKNKTLIEQQNEINLETILSAKYRIKNNHKRMIQLSKTKTS